MGVWIETDTQYPVYQSFVVTPFVGVWIETINTHVSIMTVQKVTPFVGVWIETTYP